MLLLKAKSNKDQQEYSEVKKSIEEITKEIDEVKKTNAILVERMEKIAKYVGELSKEMSRLSDSFGLILEDVARSFLPAWLYVKMGITTNKLDRAFFDLGDRFVELDFYGEGVNNGNESVLIFGESKSRIHGEDIKSFHEKVNQIIQTKKLLSTRAILLMYGLYIHPSAIQESHQRGIVLVSPYMISTY
ncbi:MAG: hypothetical protein QXK88_03110 [Desulfurococcaceae archaeon]